MVLLSDHRVSATAADSSGIMVIITMTLTMATPATLSTGSTAVTTTLPSSTTGSVVTHCISMLAPTVAALPGIVYSV